MQEENETHIVVPPPSIEADIRTMESDIEMIGKTGGAPFRETIRVGRSVSPSATHAQEISLRVPNLSGAKTQAEIRREDAGNENESENVAHIPLSREGERELKTKRFIVLAVAIVAGFIILFFAGFYFSPFFFGEDDNVADNAESRDKNATAREEDNVPVSDNTEEPGSSVFEEETKKAPIFSVSPDIVLSFDADSLIAPVARAMADLLIDSSVQFAEVRITHSGGAAFSWKEVAELLRAGFDGVFFEKNFEASFTGFLYRNEKGVWPGFVLVPLSGKLPLLLQPQVARIESSSSLTSFFPIPPSSQDVSGMSWSDGQISGQPVRVFQYANGMSFVYGWVGARLVFSTSYDGFAEAVRRLQ